MISNNALEPNQSPESKSDMQRMSDAELEGLIQSADSLRAARALYLLQERRAKNRNTVISRDALIAGTRPRFVVRGGR